MYAARHQPSSSIISPRLRFITPIIPFGSSRILSISARNDISKRDIGDKKNPLHPVCFVCRPEYDLPRRKTRARHMCRGISSRMPGGRRYTVDRTAYNSTRVNLIGRPRLVTQESTGKFLPVASNRLSTSSNLSSIRSGVRPLYNYSHFFRLKKITIPNAMMSITPRTITYPNG